MTIRPLGQPPSLRLISSLRFLLISLFIAFTSLAAEGASVIVEFHKDPAALAAAKARKNGAPMPAEAIDAYRADLAAAQDRFLAKLSAAGIVAQLGGQAINGVRVDYRYTLVFNGMNLIVDPTAAARLAAMPEVKKVHEDELLHTQLDVSVPYVRAPQVYGAVREISRYDNVREGFEGQGVYVSVIDTGVEWQHEQFGGDPTPPRLGVEPAVSGRNEKVVYYLPLADVVLEDGVGHGTHVAATAAGYVGFAPGADSLPLTADDIKMHGVAPQARIMSYKVCSDALSNVGSLSGAVGGCLSAAITMAIEDSMSPRTVNGFPKPVAHVINMSLGGSGTPDSVTALAADNAVRLGAVVVAAAGNSGPGESTAGAPCVGRLVTCVANSVDPAGSWSADVLASTSINRLVPGAVTPASSLPLASGVRSGIQLLPMSGAAPPPAGSVAQFYVYVLGGETPASYPANVAGRIAMVQTTMQATFVQVANSAAAAGAVGVIMRTPTANPTAVKAPIPAAVLPIADFDYLISLMGAGSPPANGTLSKHPLRLNPYFGQTTMNSSSSRGPVAGFGQVKPDVTGPGTNIMAAMPPASLLGVLAQGNYGAISGTSMASPHIAGAAALVRQAHPSWSADMIRTALQNTSTNLRDERGVPKADSTTAESVIDQGAGLIDTAAAVNIKALLGVTSDGISAPSILGSHSFAVVPAINGRGIVSRTVSVTLQDVSGAAGSYSLAVVNNRGLEIPGIRVNAPTSISVAANGTSTFDVTATIDGSVVTTGDPLQIQWYLRATRSDGSETLVMPFYLRATRTMPPAATMNPVADDSTADQLDGVDRDGRYTLSWSYPAEATARPCGFDIEESRATATGTIWSDDAEEVVLTGGNTTWVASNWTSRPHANTGSLGYSPVYIDNTTATLTTAQDVALPTALVELAFASSEDIEPDFDYGYVDVSADGGTSWTTAATYTGAYSGERRVDLSAFAGRNVRIRFRLVSDPLMSTPVHLGWTIDDIRIDAGAAFTRLATVAGGTTSLAVGGKQDGSYGYRVTALFDACSSNPFAGTPSNIVGISVSNATAPPMAAFTAGPNPSNANETVTFDAGASHDQDSVGGTPGIVSYQWNFGDGQTTTTTAPSVTHAYSTAGSYRVLLVVVDDDGESASSETLQTVREPNATLSGGGNVPSGDGKSSFSVDVVQSQYSPSGQFVWNDHAGKTRIQSTRITRVERNGSRATVYGDCTVNKKQSGTFVLELVDNGASDDTVSIVAGNYSGGGTVAGGGVSVTP